MKDCKKCKHFGQIILDTTVATKDTRPYCFYYGAFLQDTKGDCDFYEPIEKK